MTAVTTSNINGTATVYTCDRCGTALSGTLNSIDLAAQFKGVAHLCAADAAQLLTFLGGATALPTPGATAVASSPAVVTP